MSDVGPSHLRAGLRLLLRGVRRRTAGEALGSTIPRRRMAVEGTLRAPAPARVRRYLAATHGGAALAAERDGEVVLPPTLSALWETALALELLALDEAPFPSRGLLHLESELVSLRRIYAGSRVRCRVELDRAEAAAGGIRLALRCRTWNAAGQLCQENSMGLLVRTADGAARGPSAPRSATAPDPREWRELTRWQLPASAGRRYARVSGDYNPIHLWSWSSQLLGFRRPILHGFCTEAMVANALLERLLGGDPAALRRLQIRFRAPVPLPSTARLLVAGEPAAGHGWFRVTGDADRTCAEGEWVGDG